MNTKNWKCFDRFISLIRSIFLMPLCELEEYANEDATAFRAVAAYKNLIHDMSQGN